MGVGSDIFVSPHLDIIIKSPVEAVQLGKLQRCVSSMTLTVYIILLTAEYI